MMQRGPRFSVSAPAAIGSPGEFQHLPSRGAVVEVGSLAGGRAVRSATSAGLSRALRPNRLRVRVIQEPSTGPVRLLRAIDRVWWWTLAATVVALGLWVQQLNAPLFVDEGASWFLAYQSTWDGFWSLLKMQEVAPPPFYIGLRWVVHDLGQDGRTAMRLPVVLATLPVVPLCAVLARQIGASRVGAVSAAWLAALSPLLLQYAQQVRAYGPAVTMAMVGAVLLARAHRRGWRAWDTIVAGVALGLGPWVHYIALAPLGVLLLVVLVGAPSAARLRLLVGAVPLWVGAVWFARGQYDRVGGGVDAYVDLEWVDLRHVFATAWDGRYRGTEILLLIGTAALAVAVLVLVRSRGMHRAVLLAGLAGPAAIVLLSAIGPDITMSRYLVPAAPFVIVGLAAAVDRSWIARSGIVVLLIAGVVGVGRSLNRESGFYPDAEAVVISTLPEFENGGGTLVSDDLNTSIWLAIYVAERSAIPNFATVRGPAALVRAMCAKRPVRQLVARGAPIVAQRGWYDTYGYRTRTTPTADPDLVLIVADPVADASCPPTGAVPPVA